MCWRVLYSDSSQEVTRQWLSSEILCSCCHHLAPALTGHSSWISILSPGFFCFFSIFSVRLESPSILKVRACESITSPVINNPALDKKVHPATYPSTLSEAEKISRAWCLTQKQSKQFGVQSPVGVKSPLTPALRTPKSQNRKRHMRSIKKGDRSTALDTVLLYIHTTCGATEQQDITTGYEPASSVCSTVVYSTYLPLLKLMNELLVLQYQYGYAGGN